MKKSDIGLIIAIVVICALGAIALPFLLSDDEPTKTPAAPEATNRLADTTPKRSAGSSSNSSTSRDTSDIKTPAPVEDAKPTENPVAPPPVESAAPVAPKAVETKTVDDEVTSTDFKPEDCFEFAVTVNGRVVNLQGAGVPDARVIPTLPELLTGNVERMTFSGLGLGGDNFDPRNLYEGFASKVKGSTTTDAAGNFSLSLSGHAAKDLDQFRFALRASAQGYATGESATLLVRNGETKSGVSIEVWLPGAISGTVTVKGTKDPFVGANVEANFTGNPSGGASINVSSRGSSGTVTDTAGAFTIGGLKPGSYMVVAEAETTTGGGNTVMGVFTTSESFGPTPRTLESHRRRVTVEEGKTAGPILLELERPDELIFRLAAPAGGDVTIKLEGGSAMGPGTFSFGNDSGSASPNSEGVYTVKGIKSTHRSLLITANGFAPTKVNFMPKAGETVDLGEITLDRGATIRGKVTRNGGVGLEGVTVTASRRATGGFNMIMLGDNAASGPNDVTDKDGYFEIPNAEDGTFDLSTKMTGFAVGKAAVVVALGKDPEAVIIDLFEGASVSGNVRGPAGSSSTEASGVRRTSYRIGGGGDVSGVDNSNRIVAMCAEGDRSVSWGGDQWMWTAMSSPNRATINADGSYEIANVPAGTYTAVAVWGESTSVKKGVTVRDGERITIDFRFDVYGTIQGTITNAEGQPAANLSVEAVTEWWSDADDKRKAVTDASGRYRVSDLPIGTYYIRIAGEGRSMPSTNSRKAELTENSPTATLDIKLSASGVTVRGTVSVDAGSFKSVMIMPVDTSGGVTNGRTITGEVGANGEFLIRDVKPGSYRAYFSDQQWGSSGLSGRVNVVVPESSTEDVVVNAAFRTGTINGRVTGPNADLPQGGKFQITQLIERGGGWGADRVSVYDAIASDGTFTFGPLVEGRYRVTVTIPGFAPETTDIDLQGATTVNLRVGKASGSIEVTVETFEGAPAPTPSTGGFSTTGSFGRVTLTDSEGRNVTLESSIAFVFGNWQVGSKVTIPNLAPGRYTLLLWGSTIEPYALAVEVKSTEVSTFKVGLQRGAELTLTLQNPEAELSTEAFSTAVITVKDARGNPIPLNQGHGVMTPRQSGRSRSISGLAAGSYTITVDLPGYETATIPLNVTRGQVESRQFTLVKRTQ